MCKVLEFQILLRIWWVVQTIAWYIEMFLAALGYLLNIFIANS